MEAQCERAIEQRRTSFWIKRSERNGRVFVETKALNDTNEMDKICEAEQVDSMNTALYPIFHDA